MNPLNEPTARINLDAVRHNFNLARRLAPGSSIMAIIKADGYGHGAIPVAEALPGADAFGVSRLSEASALRDAGIARPVCLLSGILNEAERRFAFDAALDLVVHADHQLDLLAQAEERHRVWIKLDTGMGRLGFAPTRVAQVMSSLARHQVLGIMTHLANADEDDGQQTRAQLGKITSALDDPAARHLKPVVMSVGNSAGILKHPLARADWIRPGIMLYGASPIPAPVPVDTLRPAMTLTASVIAVKPVPAGQSVGYGGIWTAKTDTRVAIVAAGYADGYPREIQPGTPVLLASTGRSPGAGASGRRESGRREIVGRVSMDLMTVKLMANDQVRVGDRVILWGEDLPDAGSGSGEKLPIELIASRADTLPYTLMCGVSKRVKRDYVARGAVIADVGAAIAYAPVTDSFITKYRTS